VILLLLLLLQLLLLLLLLWAAGLHRASWCNRCGRLKQGNLLLLLLHELLLHSILHGLPCSTVLAVGRWLELQYVEQLLVPAVGVQAPVPIVTAARGGPGLAHRHVRLYNL
jgi:hypothetical protein